MAVRVNRLVSNSLPKVVVVVGPTASGKTKLAVALARRFGGEIISADSRQVYRGMDIGTGKDHSEYGRVPVHLLDVASPHGQFTVARYQCLANRAIADVLGRGKLPIICGGSGLYVDSVVYGFQFPQIRNSQFAIRELRQQLGRLSLPQLLARLRHVDAATYAVIDHHNRRRVERAVEIFYATGKPKSAQQVKSPPKYQFIFLGITRPKATLHRRIARRLQARLRQGMVAEVRRLHAEGISYRRLDAFGLEYRWASRYLRGQIDRQTMEGKLFRDIQQFARRQMVWWKRNPKITWMSTPARAVSLVKNFLQA